MLLVTAILFLAVGMAQAAFGPALPDLAAQAGTGLVQVGGIVTANFFGVVCGQALGGLALRRFGQRNVILAGLLGFIASMSAILLAPSLSILLAAAAAFGISIGAALLAGNVLAAEASSGAGPLNLVNAMFGVGAIASPALVGASLIAWKSGLPALWLSPVAAAACLALLLPGLFNAAGQHRPAAQSASSGGLKAVLATGLVWATGLLLLCDVSIEICVSTWLPKLLETAANVPLAYGAMAVSWFWLQVTVVRFVAAAISRRVGSRAMLRACAGLCGLGGLGLVAGLAAANLYLAAAAVTAIGFGIGPVFPTVLSVLRRALPEEAGLATAMAAGTGNLGGAVMPFVLGYVLAQKGAVPASVMLLAVTATLAAALVGVEVLSRSSSRRPRRAAASPARRSLKALRQMPSAN